METLALGFRKPRAPPLPAVPLPLPSRALGAYKDQLLLRSDSTNGAAKPVFEGEDTWPHFTGEFTGYAVVLRDQVEVEALFHYGCFGKGSLSRARPETCTLLHTAFQASKKPNTINKKRKKKTKKMSGFETAAKLMKVSAEASFQSSISTKDAPDLDDSSSSSDDMIRVLNSGDDPESGGEGSLLLQESGPVGEESSYFVEEGGESGVVGGEDDDDDDDDDDDEEEKEEQGGSGSKGGGQPAGDADKQTLSSPLPSPLTLPGYVFKAKGLLRSETPRAPFFEWSNPPSASDADASLTLDFLAGQSLRRTSLCLRGSGGEDTGSSQASALREGAERVMENNSKGASESGTGQGKESFRGDGEAGEVVSSSTTSTTTTTPTASTLAPRDLEEDDRDNEGAHPSTVRSESDCGPGSSATSTSAPGGGTSGSSKEFLQLSLEEAMFLVYGLGVLSVHRRGERERPLSTEECWRLFCESSPNFLPSYTAYHHFRAKGWIPRGGLKFGGDFVLYREGPEYFHSEFTAVVSMCNAARTTVDGKLGRVHNWASLHDINRMNEQVGKEVLLVYVIPPVEPLEPGEVDSPAVIARFQVQEVALRRWVPAVKL